MRLRSNQNNTNEQKEMVSSAPMAIEPDHSLKYRVNIVHQSPSAAGTMRGTVNSQPLSEETGGIANSARRAGTNAHQ